MDFIEICQAIADGTGLVDGGMLDFSDETVKRGPSGEAETDDSREEIVGEDVVIPPIARFSDAIGDAAVEKAPRLGADAGFADVELLGQGVEGQRLALEEEGAEDTTGDAGQAIAFGGESHAFDESVAFVQQEGDREVGVDNFVRSV
jgi:hypothetical protein